MDAALNLTKKSKPLIVTQFVDFQRSVDECAAIYGKRRDQIEDVLREALTVKALNDHIAERQRQPDLLSAQVPKTEKQADVSSE